MAQHQLEVGRIATREGTIYMQKELTSLRDRINVTRGMEQSLGLLTVSQSEADQTLGVFSDLNSQTS